MLCPYADQCESGRTSLLPEATWRGTPGRESGPARDRGEQVADGAERGVRDALTVSPESSQTLRGSYQSGKNT